MTANLHNRLDLANTANRRGLLLGLTLSEIMIIILFSLLLLIGAILAEQSKKENRISDLQAKVTQGESALVAIQQMRQLLNISGISSKEIDEILKEMTDTATIASDIAVTEEQLSNQTSLTSAEKLELEKKLARRKSEYSREEQRLNALKQRLAEKSRTSEPISELANALAESGITPADAKSGMKSVATLSEVMQELNQRLKAANSDPQASQKVLEQAKEKWANTAMDNRNLAEQTKYWKGRWESEVGNGKKGVTPCWATNGVVDFIYDVALTDTGLILRRNQVPQWAEDYDRLPVQAIVVGKEISQSQFIQQARPLFDYSNRKDKDCRFFVRIFDETAVNAKLIYQQRRRAVEGYFFILDMKNAKFSM